MHQIENIIEDQKIAKAVTLPLYRKPLFHGKPDNAHISESDEKSEISRSDHLSAKMNNNKNQKIAA